MPPPRFAVRSVAIIGAGSSGLTAAKYIQAQGVYDRIVVYEQRSEVGGIWNYSPRPTDQEHIPQETPYQPPDAPLWPQPSKEGSGHTAPEFPTAIYDDLYVNIPHPLMGFTDLAIAAVHDEIHPGKPLPIFPQRETIEDYLISYSQEVRHLIRFTTKVDDVRLLRKPRRRQTNGVRNGTSNGAANGEVSGVGAHGGGGDDDNYVDSWEVHATNTRDSTESIEAFDAVIVAQGHYDITFVPAIANIRAFDKAHPGVLTHSKRYRSAKPYQGKRVVVVGNAASGLDIAHQINDVCQRPLYLSVHTPTAPEHFARIVGAEELPEIQEFLVEERGVRLADGRVLRDLDAVVFCTGYLFSLPFLEKAKPPVGAKTPEGLSSLLSTGRRIHRLYDDMFHIDHPTLAFLCLPMRVVPYPLAQSQAAIVSRVWANTLDLPTKDEMDVWEREAERVRGPSFHVWPHGDDGVYINAAYKRIMEGDSPASRAGKEPPRWNDWLIWVRTVSLLAKGTFEDTGRTATSLEELGFVYNGGGGGDGTGRTAHADAAAAAEALEGGREVVDEEL